MNISEPLISWYMKHKRELPWRDTSDPYRIWLSEIILQQTRVEQGTSYYFNIVNTFPTIGMLAKAPVDKLLKLWQGLGYYSRARNMHATAVYIHEKLNGEFPQSLEGLLNLKGVGPYTAAAIASFAFKLPYAAVDGNVSRVIARLFDIAEPINSTSGSRQIAAIAQEILSVTQPDNHNQAMMELGATICTPAQPQCTLCPVQEFCESYAKNTVAQRPVKLKRAKQRLRHMDYAVIETPQHLIFRKRTGNDIWQGLHDFFAVEENSVFDPTQLIPILAQEMPGLEVDILPGQAEYLCTHLLTHQKIEARFWRIKAKGKLPENSLYLSIPKHDVSLLSVPRLIHKYLDHAGWL